MSQSRHFPPRIAYSSSILNIFFVFHLNPMGFFLSQTFRFSIFVCIKLFVCIKQVSGFIRPFPVSAMNFMRIFTIFRMYKAIAIGAIKLFARNSELTETPKQIHCQYHRCGILPIQAPLFQLLLFSALRLCSSLSCCAYFALYMSWWRHIRIHQHIHTYRLYYNFAVAACFRMVAQL